MSTLADLISVYAPAAPAGFTLANIELANQQAEDTAALGRSRTLRNFGLTQQDAETNRGRLMRNYSRFDLPDLLSGQAARGAFQSSATDHKRERLTTGLNDMLTDINTGVDRQRIGTGDTLSDIQLALSQQQSMLAANALLAQSGISLG